MAATLTYRVNTPTLNLRAGPSTTAAKLGVITAGEQLTPLVDSARQPGWIRVNWRGRIGYAAEKFLTPVEVIAAPPQAPAAHGAPAPAAEKRDTDLFKLHPTVREAVAETLQTLEADGAPFRLFEGFRPPERQAWLYAQGRTRPGGVVTKAQAWQSYHQYGLAVDLVLFRDNGWSWSSSGADASLWKRMHEVAHAHGLRPLSFELPHVEFAGPDWRDLQRGRGYPAEGDESWWDALTEASVRWARAGTYPLGPALQLAERPALSGATA
jgi:hypothetical protein